MKRVLAILYQFPPSREVGAQSSAQICRYLPANGWDVSVLTVRERYIPDTDPQIGEPFPGHVIRTRVMPHPLSLYRWLKTLGSRTPQDSTSPTVNNDSVKRGGALRQGFVALLGIPDPYTGWIAPAVIGGLAAIRREKINCLFSSGPWWTNHLVALVLAEITGLPWIAHFRDSWAQGHWVKQVTGLSVRIEKALERLVVRKARAVVCVTDMQTNMLRQAHAGVSPSKFITIPNGYDEAEWTGATSESPAAAVSNEKFVITYAGNLYHGRSPYPLFRTLRALSENGEIDRERVRVELLGNCDVAEGSRVSDVAAQYGLSGCLIMPGVLARNEAIQRMRQSSLLLLLIDEQNYSIPGKTYEYLRAGRPILALTQGGAAIDLLHHTGGAWVVDPANIEGIKAAVRDAYLAWSRGVDARVPDQDVVGTYDRRVLARRLIELLDTTMAPPLIPTPIQHNVTVAESD